VDTGQATCYDDNGTIDCPDAGEPFYGQDAQVHGRAASYTNNEDGTIADNVTGMMWQQSPDTNTDGTIDSADKLSYDEAVSYCNNLSLAGHTDWRLPDIKQLYSLMNFQGTDPSGYTGTDTSSLIPFLDDDYFAFAYGDTSAGARLIDAQYASSTRYVALAMGQDAMFGVNFADGRIKAYPIQHAFFVLCVRGGSSYGENRFVDHGDGTITDQATALMWAQDDSGMGLNWEDALAWVAQQNTANYLGYNDWRLPNAKELQSIVDYSRSPDTSGSAAIDPLFNTASITNEAGEADYPSFWSSTTHANWTITPGEYGAYVAFGRAMGYMNGSWDDVHGAGAQRSDPKSGDPSEWPTGHGPQGDAIRIYNYVRLVRDADGESATPTPTPNPTRSGDVDTPTPTPTPAGEETTPTPTPTPPGGDDTTPTPTPDADETTPTPTPIPTPHRNVLGTYLPLVLR
jgi:hypothetical protein